MPDICTNRHGGNEESLEASRSLDGGVTADGSYEPPVKPLLRLQVESLLACAGPRGLTSEDVEAALGLSHQTASARLTEILARGYGFKGERRITKSGRYARAVVYFEHRSEDAG